MIIPNASSNFIPCQENEKVIGALFIGARVIEKISICICSEA